MREVHARFKGKKGTFAQFGDSITVTMAFWAPLDGARKNAPPKMEEAFRRVKAHMLPECWRSWKGPQYGSEGGMTVRWARENVDTWLSKLNPEAALIMFGTNDLHSMEVEEHRAKLKEVVEKCLANGTVVILSTIPPRAGFEAKAKAFAEAARGLARELKVPLLDFHEEVMRRRPKDWNGASEEFKQYKDYDVPTLLSRDGVHPSYPQKFRDDYSEEALRSSGYGLRSYLTLLTYGEVIERVLAR